MFLFLSHSATWNLIIRIYHQGEADFVEARDMHSTLGDFDFVGTSGK
jgi:hypothetical protein